MRMAIELQYHQVDIGLLMHGIAAAEGAPARETSQDCPTIADFQ